LDQAVISDKDRHHPPLAEATAVRPRRTLVVGCRGQLGRALRERLGDGPQYDYVDLDTFDLTDPAIDQARHWPAYEAIINAAAYTAVDAAETPAGRADAWQANAAGVANLARIASRHGLTLVHISTDYVFDGTKAGPYTEADRPCPVSVYGASKAAGDAAAATVPRHYILRTSWVVGDGKNFVRTMADLAARGVKPSVVDDQTGRLTFTADLAAAAGHLLRSRAPYGVYNVTGEGTPMTWAEVARRVFSLVGAAPADITPVTTADYFAAATAPVAPRPANSVLSLDKLEAAGFTPRDAAAALAEYLAA
jgi:dTDP-4-dehydrorhamnose 3,5-epimerase